jgi:hypothetical protein
MSKLLVRLWKAFAELERRTSLYRNELPSLK